MRPLGVANVWPAASVPGPTQSGDGSGGIVEVWMGLFLVVVLKGRSEPVCFRLGALFLCGALKTPLLRPRPHTFINPNPSFETVR